MASWTSAFITLVVGCSLAGHVGSLLWTRSSNSDELPDWTYNLINQSNGYWCNDKQVEQDNGERDHICVTMNAFYNHNIAPGELVLGYLETVNDDPVRCLVGVMDPVDKNTVTYSAHTDYDCLESGEFSEELGLLETLLDPTPLISATIWRLDDNTFYAKYPVATVAGLAQGSFYKLTLDCGFIEKWIPPGAPERPTKIAHRLEKKYSFGVSLPEGVESTCP